MTTGWGGRSVALVHVSVEVGMWQNAVAVNVGNRISEWFGGSPKSKPFVVCTTFGDAHERFVHFIAYLMSREGR